MAVTLTRRKLGWSDEYVSSVALGTMVRACPCMYVCTCVSASPPGGRARVRIVRAHARALYFLMVSRDALCVQTWGIQNTEAEAHAQLDFFVKECKGNLIDTAELYPVPTTGNEYRPGAYEHEFAQQSVVSSSYRIGVCAYASLADARAVAANVVCAGTTELMVGTWMAKNKALRKDVFLGTIIHPQCRRRRGVPVVTTRLEWAESADELTIRCVAVV